MAILEKWEYKCVPAKEINPDLKISDMYSNKEKLARNLEEWLNKIGADGWEWFPLQQAHRVEGFEVIRRRVSP